MNWYELKSGSLIDLDKLDWVKVLNLNNIYYTCYFINGRSQDISKEDYEDIKNILLNGGK